MKNNKGFVMVYQKNESNKDFEISKKGSYVEIIDFNSLPNGLLGITVKCMNKVLIGNEIRDFLFERLRNHQGTNEEIISYDFSNTSGVMSDIFSFLDQSAEEMTAKSERRKKIAEEKRKKKESEEGGGGGED